MKPTTIRVLFTVVVCISGCTTTSTLQTSTISQGRTITEMLYQMVLDNLTMILAEKEALPWYLNIAQGGIGITDATSPTLAFTWSPIVRNAGLTATRQWAVSWTVVPVLDRDALLNMRGRYQRETKDDFEKYYRTGNDAPRNVLHGKFGGKFVWVAENQLGHFTTLVADILTYVPKEEGPGALKLPGPQTPPLTVR